MIPVYHILPRGEDHKEHASCRCEPRIVEYEDHIQVIHNSFDGREGVELANEVLNNLPEKPNSK